MPTINVDKKEFLKLINKKLTDKEIEEKISEMGIAVEAVNNQEIIFEIFANRPDLLSKNCLVRFVKNYFKNAKSRSYSSKKSNYKLNVNHNVKEIRPYITCAIVKGLKLDDENLTEIIQLQEKLHITFGRNRKKISIGIYPLKEIEFPLTYEVKKPEEIKFQPLGHEIELSAYEILEKHPKGKEFKHLLESTKFYPILRDNKNKILSLIPIINSNLTGKVTGETREVFIECTGSDFNSLSKCLNIIVASLADMGGEIYSVEINSSNKKIITPNLKEEEMKIEVDYINKKLGLSLNSKEIKKLLERMGYKVKEQKNKFNVLIPSYRVDVIHPIDLVEDVAIAYGYNNLKEEIPKIATIAEENNFEIFKNKIANILIGLNFLECNSYNLDSKENQFLKMNLNKDLPFVELANSLSKEYNILRFWLTPKMIKILSENKHNEYPQKIFSIGKDFKLDSSKETKVKETQKLSCVIAHEKSNFTEIKQVLDYLTKLLNVNLRLKELKHNSFIEGRCASIFINDKEIGFLGEINPKVLENFELLIPVSALELDLDKLLL